MKEIHSLFAASPNVVQSVKKLIEDDAALKAGLEKLQKEKTAQLFDVLRKEIKQTGDVDLLEWDCSKLKADVVKDLAFKFKAESNNICFIAYGADEGKVSLSLMLGEELVANGKDASKIIRSAAKHIKGGGGGQKYFASAGGKDVSGIEKAIEEIKKELFG